MGRGRHGRDARSLDGSGRRRSSGGHVRSGRADHPHAGRRGPPARVLTDVRFETEDDDGRHAGSAIDDRFFGGAGSTDPRALDLSALGLGDMATSPTHLVLYDPETGELAVDPDASGETHPTTIAILRGAPILDADAILLF